MVDSALAETLAGLGSQKLATKESERRDLEASRMERHLWLIDALQDSAALASLSTMHSLVQAWLARNDDEIDELEKARKERGSWRKAEGKSQRQMNLEAQRETDALEYKSGFCASLASALHQPTR